MSDPSFASTPAPPYFAVIFSLRRSGGDAGFGITVSYWRSDTGDQRGSVDR